jgi:hypothetical protein
MTWSPACDGRGLAPACASSALGGLAALLGRHARSAGFATLQPAFASQLDRCGVLPVILGRVLDLARSDVYDQLAKLVGVARTFAWAVGHDPRVPARTAVGC